MGSRNLRSNSVSTLTSLTMEAPKITITQKELDEIVKNATDAAIKSVHEFFDKKLQEQQLMIEKQQACIDNHELLLGSLREELGELKGRLRQAEVDNNHLEQYSRRSHLRIYGLNVTGNCKDAVASFISHKLKNADGSPLLITSKDIDAAHPLPVRNTTPKNIDEVEPVENRKNEVIPPIIVRFHARDVRDAVIRARRQLKGGRISIAEDLTSKNARLLKKLKDSKDFDSAWSWNGRIHAKHKGGHRGHRFDIFDA